MFSAVFAILYILIGSACLWTGITFINGTLFSESLSKIYTYITSPFLRMLTILPIMGVGHLFFSLAMKNNPNVASPVSIVFTVIPPIIYGLWLINSYPSGRIYIYIALLIVIAFLLSFEMNKLSH